MRKIEIELNDDIADELVLSELKSQYQNLVDDYLLRKQGEGIPVFHTNPEIDTMILKTQCDAFELVLQYNMTPDEYKTYSSSVAITKLTQIIEENLE